MAFFSCNFIFQFKMLASFQFIFEEKKKTLPFLGVPLGVHSIPLKFDVFFP